MSLLRTTYIIFFATLLLARGSDPVSMPIQLQFIQPDSVQEDLTGNVKAVDAKSYKSSNGAKGTSEGKKLDTYTSQGGALAKSRWDENGSIKSKETTYYDSQGNFVRQEILKGNETDPSICKKTFDPTERKVTAETKTSSGDLTEKKVTAFDNYGKEHEVIHYDPSGAATERCTMERNQQGKEVTVVFYGPDDQEKNRIDITWNSDGSQATESFSDPSNGVTTQVTFEYPSHDSHGNWTSRIEKSVYMKGDQTIGESQTITEREITYY
jgi:hypothetical protein